MMRLSPALAAVTFAVLSSASVDLAHAQSEAQHREWMYRQYLQLHHYVRGGAVEPHWLNDGERFWFVVEKGDGASVDLVDPARGTRSKLFDLSILEDGFQRILKGGGPAAQISVDDLQLTGEHDQLVHLTIGRQEVELDTRTGELILLREAVPPASRPRRGEVVSPNAAWAARIEEGSVWLRSLRGQGEEALTMDATPDQPWAGPIMWSPDGSRLAVLRMDKRAVTKIPIVSHLTPAPQVQRVPLWQSEGPFETSDLFFLDVETEDQVKADMVPRAGLPDQLYPLGWLPDGSEFLFARVSRDFQRLQVSAASRANGHVRELFSEVRETFFHIPAYRPLAVTILPESGQFLWTSDREGWHHIYLYDFRGSLVRRLTDGPREVVEVIGADEKNGWVYFTAHADPSHPYDTHLCRVRLQGGEVHTLTEGRGIHRPVLSPHRDFFVDTHTNVNLLPTVELRTAAGALVDTLSVAEVDAPQGFKWVEPEEFVVKAADGETDLHGVLYKPYDFDPTRQYPVVEIMVGRPTVAVNEILRTHSLGGEALAQLGFIVIALDGRGTPERGRLFHELVYRSMGRHEIPDHTAALRQLFERRPYMDRSRVGVMGVSYGGYYAIRAMLQAPDIYRVGVVVAPYDPRGDAVLPYMGLPQENQRAYEFASNLTIADRLEGHLLIQHGSADAGAYFFWTMQLVEALIQAGKPVDLMVFPDDGHVLRPESEAYAREVRSRYFQEHLQAAGASSGG